jgi:drug/metabolite transporter (DMT)-like permease
VDNFGFLATIVIVSAGLVGMGFILIHDTASKIDSFVNLHYTYMGHMLATSVAGVQHQPSILFDQVTPSFLGLVLGMLVFGWASQLFLYESSRMERPSRVMPFCYVTIIISFLADIYLFDISFGLLSVLGMLLTSSGLLGKLLI